MIIRYLRRLWALVFLFVLSIATWLTTSSSFSAEDQLKFVQIEAYSKEQRSEIANLGISIEFIRSDAVWGFAREGEIVDLQSSGFKVLSVLDAEVGRGGHGGPWDFPGKDGRFHNYKELTADVKALQSTNADIVRVDTIGKSIGNKEIWAVHINTDPGDLMKGTSNKPGIVFMGTHHAREHVSTEIPLMLAQHLLKNRNDAKIGALLESRDIWIIPMVNPDGAEYDIETGSYRMWRKNRRDNKNGSFGVDLNRNYGYQWGTGGSSSNTSSDTYMGVTPFSEPETSAVKTFVDDHLNIKVLLTFHTFSELILYPWGHKYDPISDQRDLKTYQALASAMAGWNHYTAEQSSDLYIASGDTTDWAYGEHGIFSFTFELSPKSMWDGGFYPGAGIIDKVFQDNLKPCLYLMDLADDPHRAAGKSPSRWLKNYVEPSVSPEAFLEINPGPSQLR